MNRLYEGMSIQEISAFLFLCDAPAAADLLFVLAGRRPGRAAHAAALYQAGYSRRIWAAGGRLGPDGEPQALRLRRELVAAGVPAEAIAVDNCRIHTADQVKSACDRLAVEPGWQELHRILLVAAPVQMRRLWELMRRHVPATTELLCCPDPGADVRADNWWSSEEGRRLVLKELEKVRDVAFRGVC